MVSGFTRPAWVIYALAEPEGRPDGRLTPGTVRYVGYSKNPEKRFAEHLSDAEKLTTPVYNWIRCLQNLGLKPLMVILHHGKNNQSWEEVEAEWISRYGFGQSPCHILNLMAGGQGGAIEGPVGKVIKQKLSEAGRAPNNLAHLARLKSSVKRRANHARYLASADFKADCARLAANPVHNARLAANRARMQQARAAGCRTLAEYSALLKSQQD